MSTKLFDYVSMIFLDEVNFVEFFLAFCWPFCRAFFWPFVGPFCRAFCWSFCLGAIPGRVVWAPCLGRNSTCVNFDPLGRHLGVLIDSLGALPGLFAWALCLGALPGPMLI